MTKNALETKVIDNKVLSMVEAFRQLLPLGNGLSVAVGYFFLGGYELIREDFNRIAINGGARIIVGNNTDQRTAIEINEGISSYEAYASEEVALDLPPQDAIYEELTKIVDGDKRAEAAWQLRDLIKHGKLKIRVYTGNSSYFHSKLYLVQRGAEFDGFAIVGSSNFSKGGLTGNSELNVLTMDSYPSLHKWFDELWDSGDVEDFSLSLMNVIEERVSKPINYSPPEGLLDCSAPLQFSIPQSMEVREYQKDAVRCWFQHDGCGILEMATGTGKTITSLIAAAKLYEHTKKLALVIVCPYQHLVLQWQKECLSFGLKPLLGYVSKKNWENDLNAAIASFNMGASDVLCLITTNDTFASEVMQKSLQKLNSDAMVIADECHHLGAPDMLNRLLSCFNYRLGLSATPDRWYDDEGTESLRDYFKNGSIYSFPLKDAIGPFLSEYYYYPHIVELTDEESDEYLEISKKISGCYAINSDVEFVGNSQLKTLLIKRARIISKAENKYSLLRRLLIGKEDSKHNIFYCGSAIEDGERQVDKLVKMLGEEVGMKVHPFTSHEDRNKRLELLAKFETGELQGLVAIKCLDEGVDVPATETAYILASSTNPREFIQRRGRLLRKSPNKKYSYIHDFIVIPRPLDEINKLESTIFNTERKLVKRELERFKEFAELAINYQKARLDILDVASRFNLLDI